jgi:hypothetical protein
LAAGEPEALGEEKQKQAGGDALGQTEAAKCRERQAHGGGQGPAFSVLEAARGNLANPFTWEDAVL